MYESFYGLKERPFSVEPDPAYAYHSRQQEMAVASVVYAADNKLGLALLTGPVGVGKTTVAQMMLAAWASDEKKTVAFVPDPTARTKPAFLRLLLEGFGLEAGRYAAENQRALERYLLAEYDAGRHAIVLIDEGQKISAENLDTIADLTNFQLAKSKLVTFIIFAEDTFSNKTKGKKSFRSRIAVPVIMNALTYTDTENMLTHRLTMAGGGPVADYFASDAVHSIYRITRGIPRDICMLGDAVLLRGFMEDQRVVPDQTVVTVAQEMSQDKDWHLDEAPAAPKRRTRKKAE